MFGLLNLPSKRKEREKIIVATFAKPFGSILTSDHFGIYYQNHLAKSPVIEANLVKMARSQNTTKKFGKSCHFHFLRVGQRPPTPNL